MCSLVFGFLRLVQTARPRQYAAEGGGHAVHRASRGFYGAPWVYRELQEKGVRYARK